MMALGKLLSWLVIILIQMHRIKIIQILVQVQTEAVQFKPSFSKAKALYTYKWLAKQNRSKKTMYRTVSNKKSNPKN